MSALVKSPSNTSEYLGCFRCPANIYPSSSNRQVPPIHMETRLHCAQSRPQPSRGIAKPPPMLTHVDDAQHFRRICQHFRPSEAHFVNIPCCILGHFDPKPSPDALRRNMKTPCFIGVSARNVDKCCVSSLEKRFFARADLTSACDKHHDVDRNPRPSDRPYRLRSRPAPWRGRCGAGTAW